LKRSNVGDPALSISGCRQLLNMYFTDVKFELFIIKIEKVQKGSRNIMSSMLILLSSQS